jgi:hypothetical protein
MSMVSGAAVADAFAFGSLLQAITKGIITRHNAGNSRVVHFIFSPLGKLIMTSSAQTACQPRIRFAEGGYS